MARKRDTEGETYETEPESDTDTVQVEITADHIYLPLDAEGNVPATWASAADTVRVGRGTKLAMPPDCVEMLGDRVKVSP